ncbi:hypothetical protein LCGC14_2925040 [marine sediment metagenome]|uniref:Uncharacterized protein n=1 Tax=marine sediment metagenome TaxID=412755 RepID=A0A0F8ZVB4_9ZZZZ
MTDLHEPNWKDMCMRLWRDAHGGYDQARPETVRVIVDEIDAWVQCEALRPGATCSSCGADIVWGKTKAGKRIPLDAAPIGGLMNEETGEVMRLRQTHFATCPNAKEHRKR